MKRLVVFTGAGISAESGIKTFRDSGGLWENYAVEDVATPHAWYKNPELVLEFYNQRRKQVISAKPNAAHLSLVELEKGFEVVVITQNIDDLHERAGSSQVVHLHGEIMKSRSSLNPSLIYQMEGDSILLGDKCERGSQLRPHIVWFGESVPMMDKAIEITEKADIFLVIGTSLAVYPAASLLQFTPEHTMTILIDPNANADELPTHFTVVAENAAYGVPQLVKKLLKAYV
ncbi:MAG: NAD-dependent deacylase [Bacteroidetes bacterium]|nr:NAD-dependent deacylase [Bacteroidota bacterium]